MMSGKRNLAVVIAELRSAIESRVFCSTGKGGGKDASCSPKDAGGGGSSKGDVIAPAGTKFTKDQVSFGKPSPKAKQGTSSKFPGEELADRAVAAQKALRGDGKVSSLSDKITDAPSAKPPSSKDVDALISAVEKVRAADPDGFDEANKYAISEAFGAAGRAGFDSLPNELEVYRLSRKDGSDSGSSVYASDRKVIEQHIEDWGGKTPDGYEIGTFRVSKSDIAHVLPNAEDDWQPNIVVKGSARPVGKKKRSVTPAVESRSLAVERRALAVDDTTHGAPSLRVESRCECQDDGAESKREYIVGYAAKFGVNSLDLGKFTERIAPSAFGLVAERRGRKKTLETRALFNHNADLPLAKYPGTLKLSVDDIGLRYEFPVPDTSYGRDLAANIRDGIVSGSSFSFTVPKDGEEWSMEEGRSIRTVTKIDSLIDVGPVTYPAYPDTDAAVAQRSYDEFMSRVSSAKRPRRQHKRHISSIARRAAADLKSYLKKHGRKVR